jgi:hypothetical protein
VSSLRFQIAKTEEEKKLVCQLRYKVFAHEMGFHATGDKAEAGMALASDEYATLILVMEDELPIATITINSLEDGAVEEALTTNLMLEEFVNGFGEVSVVVAHKLFILPRFRSATLVMEVVAFLMKEVLRPPLSFCFVESSPYLVHHYEKFGFRRYAPHFTWENTGTLSVPMCMLLTDHEYLSRNGAFLVPLLEAVGFMPETLARQWFQERWSVPHSFPASIPEIPEIGVVALEELELFDGIPPWGIRDLLEGAEILNFQRKDMLVVSGDTEQVLMALLEGYVEVTVMYGDRYLPIATLGPGHLLGEMNFLLEQGRTANVTALTSGQALCIPTEVLEQFQKYQPALAAQMYRNLARILAVRLKQTNRWVTQSPPL